jgi:hypothetical protein
MPHARTWGSGPDKGNGVLLTCTVCPCLASALPGNVLALGFQNSEPLLHPPVCCRLSARLPTATA